MRILLPFVVLMILISCSEKSKNPLFDRKQTEQIIKIDYIYSFADRINTFEKYCTKDLVLDGDITIDFWFQQDAQDTIIALVEKIDFFNLPDTLKYISLDSISTIYLPDPGIQQLRIQFGEQDKTVYWFHVNSYPEEYDRLKQLTTLIKSIVCSDSEYQLLPEPTGGYL